MINNGIFSKINYLEQYVYPLNLYTCSWKMGFHSVHGHSVQVFRPMRIYGADPKRTSVFLNGGAGPRGAGAVQN